MSGASGKVPAAIHVSPERWAAARWRACAMAMSSGCAPSAGRSMRSSIRWSGRRRDDASDPPAPAGTGRELFAFMRRGSDEAERGASAMLAAMEAQ
jgi:phosphogluconate dehydratase